MQVLEGILVLEMGTFITGPYAGMLLADLGAEVIKIERPGTGDPFRGFEGGLYSPHFRAYNRNKKSLTLNLADEAGQEVFRRLVRKADVFVENFRPGVTDRMGITEADLRPLNEGLVYCSITGFGHDGPYRRRPSYDTVAQGLSGLVSMLLDPEDPRMVGPAFSDGLTGLYACYGILGALFERERTGVGRKVETTMLESTISFLTEPFSSYFGTGSAPGPYTRPMVSQSYAFACRDGLLLGIHLSSPEKFWQALIKAVGREELARDPRFDSRKKRIENYLDLQDELAEAFLQQPRSHWLRQLEEHDVPFTPIYTTEQVLEDPHVRHLDTFYEVEHPTEGLVKGVKRPIFYDGMRDADVTPPPALGEHTDEILQELGYSPEEIKSLREAAAV